MSELTKLEDIYWVLYSSGDGIELDSSLSAVENEGQVFEFWESLRSEPPRDRARFSSILIKYRPEIKPLVEELAQHEDAYIRLCALHGLTFTDSKERAFKEIRKSIEETIKDGSNVKDEIYLHWLFEPFENLHKETAVSWLKEYEALALSLNNVKALDAIREEISLKLSEL